MKRILNVVTFILFTCPFIYAQEPLPRVEIKDAEIEKKGESITVTFTVLSAEFPSDYSTKLMPILYNGEGYTCLLEPLTLVGKRRNISDKRTGYIEGKRIIMRDSKNEPISYSYTFPHEEWMDYVSLSVDQISEKCCNRYEHDIETVLQHKLLTYKLIPYYDIKLLSYELTELERYELNHPFLHSMEEYHKRYHILLNQRGAGASSITFKIGTHQIEENDWKNKQVLASIDKAIKLIENEPNATLRKIVIGGYTSPEGSLTFNTKLAQQRTEAVKNFLKKHLRNLDNNIFELYNGREDWNGLKELVSKSDMPEKEEVLRIIDNNTMEQEVRKTKLKQLNGGTTYKYMLNSLFPSLRNAGYVQVYYEIQRGTNGAQFLIDEQGRSVWIDTHSTQNQRVVDINKAIELIVDEHHSEALELLMPYTNDNRVWNYIGVCYMMTEKYNKAERYFRKAQDTGDRNAKKNREQLQWIKKMK